MIRFSFRQLIVAIIALIAALPASAQLKVGPKVGLNVTTLHFNKELFKSENRAGFTGGVVGEFIAPGLGIGADISALYSRSTAQWMEANKVAHEDRDYISIPLNLKWKLPVPTVRPFITTGPEVSFLASKKDISAAWHNHTVNWAWNFGIGAEVIDHIQVAASYGLGLGSSLKGHNFSDLVESAEAKNNVWTVTIAYLF